LAEKKLVENRCIKGGGRPHAPKKGKSKGDEGK